MLHIVNGDTVAENLSSDVVDGDVLVWRDIYSAGPIFIDLVKEDNRRIRADYLEKAMGIPSGEYISGCEFQVG